MGTEFLLHDNDLRHVRRYIGVPCGTIRVNDMVLFLCCCSNRKLAGGENRYRPENSVAIAIPNRRNDLHQRRVAALQCLQGKAQSAISGNPLRDLPYNAQPPLAVGPDFGGNAGGMYWPASRRYRGRFYENLDPEERGLLSESPHRWLIVSALYGLVTPEESIQRYSCDIRDDPGFTDIWKQGGFLTSLLLEYARAFNVGMVVDLLADNSYRALINWERIGRKVRILRAFGNQNSGPSLLPALGLLVRERLLRMPTEELLAIAEGRTFRTDYEDVVLTPSYHHPPEPFLNDSDPPEGEPQSSPREAATSSDSAQASPILEGACAILPNPREIRVTSNEHRTIFGRRINHIRELPPEARRLIEEVSRASEVLEVRLGEFWPRGGRNEYCLDFSEPGDVATGRIEGQLRGPGQIRGTQSLLVQVSRGREQQTYNAIMELLGRP